MKITNTRCEDLVERTINNGLAEGDKTYYLKSLNPKGINITLRVEQLRNKTNGEETNIVQMKNIDYIELSRPKNITKRNLKN